MGARPYASLSATTGLLQCNAMDRTPPVQTSSAIAPPAFNVPIVYLGTAVLAYPVYVALKRSELLRPSWVIGSATLFGAAFAEGRGVIMRLTMLASYGGM